MSRYIYDPTLPITVTAWLAHDSYVGNPDIYSATSLLKSVRQIILTQRAEAMHKLPPAASLKQMFASRMGTSIHEGIERVWTSGDYKEALLNVGIKQASIDKIVVNPASPSDVPPGHIAAYFEKAVEGDFGEGWWSGGTADSIFDGQLGDYKSTKSYSYNDKGKARLYTLQGSIYRAAAPNIITKDTIEITHLFTDWTMGNSMRTNFPPAPIMTTHFPLLSINETKRYVRTKLNMVDELIDAEDSEIPLCDDEELWSGPPQYKYYSKPTNVKASAVFDNLPAANAHARKKGTGIVLEVKGTVRACNYCEARLVCKQRISLTAEGRLK